MNPYFYLFIRLLSALLSFLSQDACKTKSNCTIVCCNSSKKHKLTLYKTQNGQPNYVDHKFFFIFTRNHLPVKNLGERQQNTIELVSWLVHVL